MGPIRRREDAQILGRRRRCLLRAAGTGRQHDAIVQLLSPQTWPR